MIRHGENVGRNKKIDEVTEIKLYFLTDRTPYQHRYTEDGRIIKKSKKVSFSEDFWQGVNRKASGVRTIFYKSLEDFNKQNGQYGMGREHGSGFFAEIEVSGSKLRSNKNQGQLQLEKNAKLDEDEIVIRVYFKPDLLLEDERKKYHEHETGFLYAENPVLKKKLYKDYFEKIVALIASHHKGKLFEKVPSEILFKIIRNIIPKLYLDSAVNGLFKNASSYYFSVLEHHETYLDLMRELTDDKFKDIWSKRGHTKKPPKAIQGIKKILDDESNDVEKILKIQKVLKDSQSSISKFFQSKETKDTYIKILAASKLKPKISFDNDLNPKVTVEINLKPLIELKDNLEGVRAEREREKEAKLSQK